MVIEMTFIVERHGFWTGKAQPIGRAAVLIKNMMLPVLSALEQLVRLRAVRQKASVRVHILCNVFPRAGELPCDGVGSQSGC